MIIRCRRTCTSQLTPAGVARPGWSYRRLAAAWQALSPEPAALLGDGRRRRRADDRRRRADHPPGHRAGPRPAALLRPPAADRTRLASAPDRHLRPGLPGHGQQRRRARAQPPGRHRGGDPAVRAAEHQLALLLRRHRRLRRTHRRAAARSAGHRAARQLRQRGGRPGAADRPHRHRPPGRHLPGRRLPRLDDGDRRDLHLAERQPGVAGHPTAVDPPGRDAQPLPRRASRPGRRRPLRRLRPRHRRRAAGRAGGVHRRADLRQRRRGRAPGRLPAAGLRRRPRRGRAGDLRRGADRLRPDRRGVLGLRAARRRAGRDHDGQGRRQRPPDRVRGHPPGDRRGLLRRGILLLLRRRQPGVVGGRPRRARHDPRRGPAGQRRAGSAPT